MANSVYVPKPLRRFVRERALGRREYCYSPDSFTTEPFVIEHIFPQSLGGQTSQDNLAYACSGCNGHKSIKTSGVDPKTESNVKLFHPRTEKWSAHFEWNESLTKVVGLTATGRATIDLLNLNRRPLQNLRRALILVGVHPPSEEII